MRKIIILKLVFVFISLLAISQENQISNKILGRWINTSLFDSTCLQKKLWPWINEFYGDAILQINPNDSISIFGCMDSGTIKYKVIDKYKFSTDEIYNNQKFEYLESSDVIIMHSPQFNLSPLVFRRVKSEDRLDIIKNEKKFEEYFIKQFFEKFLQSDKTLKIVELWIGFLTHTPFEFDALGIKTKKGIQYFGWELKDNFLRLYKTKRKIEDGSGFYYWTKGNIFKEINLK